MLLLPVAMGSAAYVYSKNQDVIYEARATLLVQQRRSDLATGIDFSGSQQLASIYRRQVRSSPFLARVADHPDVSLSVAELRQMMSARTESLPAALEIGLRNADRLLVQQVTSVVADEFIEYVLEQQLADIARTQAAAAAQGLANVEGLVAAQANAIDSLSLLEPVDLPQDPVLPRTRQNVIVGIILGGILASMSALVLGTLGDTVGNPDELTRRFGVTALGAIFKWPIEEVGDHRLLVLGAPSSGYSESFRQLRANLQFATVNRSGNVYLVTSPGPEDGKSTIISNIAITLAQNGDRVLLIDGDLRRPSIHRLFGLPSREPGLSNALAGQTKDLAEVIQPSGVEGVNVIPGGVVPPNPSELLGSARMSALLESAKEHADVVLVDSPPVLMVADSTILASQADGAIVVVDGSGTRSSSLNATLEALNLTNVPILDSLVKTRFEEVPAL